MTATKPLPATPLPPSTIILARAVVEAAKRSGKPVRDARIYEAARRPLPTETTG